MRGRGHRRRAVAAAGREHRDIANARLHHGVALGDIPQRLLVQPDVWLARDDRDRRRHRPAGAHCRLDFARDAQVVRPRQAVADDGAFQGNDRPAGSQRVGHLGMNGHGLHPTSPR